MVWLACFSVAATHLWNSLPEVIRNPGRTPIWKGWGCLSEKLNETLNETNLRIPQAFLTPNTS